MSTVFKIHMQQCDIYINQIILRGKVNIFLNILHYLLYLNNIRRTDFEYV